MLSTLDRIYGLNKEEIDKQIESMSQQLEEADKKVVEAGKKAVEATKKLLLSVFFEKNEIATIMGVTVE